MVDFSKVGFLKSCPSLKDGPEKKLPEVLFVGKSNVGKSSLINALCGRKNLAYTSSKPGFTKLLNYFVIDKKFYLVDAPGYGYTNSGSRHLSDLGKMMEDYFQNPHLQLVVFLVDSRHGFSKDDQDFYAFLTSSQIPFVLAVTKGDKLNQKDRANLRKKMQLDAPGLSYIEVSSLRKDAIEELRGLIASNLKL